MDVFSIREKIITAYSEYAQSFIQIQDDRIRSHVDYRSKRVILEIYDQMMALPAMHVPAPKPEHGQIEVPDVSQWVSPLDPRAAHEAE